MTQGITRRMFALAVLGGFCSLALPGCKSENENTVVIYSCGEGMANELLLSAMHRDLPEYDIRLHYVTTGTCAARLKTEGVSSEADIVLMLEGGYLRQIQPSLAVLDGYDFSAFESDLLDGSRTYLPFRRESACVAMNVAELEAKGLAVPSSYDDLLDSSYRGLVSMPNPKSSGTGYNFLRSLINSRGEEAALAYFDGLAENIYQFSSSGSGPVNALVQGEALIGLGMTYQAVSEINQGVPIEIGFFAEGSPWTMNGVAIVDGKQEKPAVRAVMDWMFSTGIMLDKQEFVPDKVFVDQHTEIPNFPQNMEYADMSGIFDIDEKQRLLKKWKY
ncbi:MAG: extracellular solute-binding protein [Gordonibacter sp.]|uniref:extracellular solute-binding protein n=1 Tax=Gordonibacter sp. TaxID=1968902 RepID=UPI002FC9C2CD